MRDLGSRIAAVVVVVVVVAALAQTALAAVPSGTASVDTHDVFVSAAATFTFTVNNTGTVPVGSVSVLRPSKLWRITACPLAPAGWTALKHKSVSCSYGSLAGTGDDISPSASSSAFAVTAKTIAAHTDIGGAWKVTLDANDNFNGGTNAVRAVAASAGALSSKGHIWELLDAVVSGSSSTPGTSCPASNKAANASQSIVLVICGKNHANEALKPLGGSSSLGGTFIGAPGTLASSAIHAASTASVVLANYPNSVVTSSSASGETVIALIGSSSTATSPSTTFNGYSTTSSDTTPPTPGTVADGAGSDIDFQAATDSITANWSGFSDDVGIDHYDYEVSTSPSCTGDVVSPLDVGTDTSHTATGLSLASGTTYYQCVEAVDAAANSSGFIASNGVTVDTDAPTTGTVNDGVASDVDQQASNTTMDANWSGFADSPSGIASYDYNLSTTAACTGDVIATTNVGAVTSNSSNSLSLTGDAIYYNCVRAVDAVGNTSPFVASNGVTVTPLSFNPTSVSINGAIGGSSSSDLQNGGGLSCSFTITAESPAHATPTSGTVAPGSSATITVTIPGLSGSGTRFVTATSATCGTVKLTVHIT
jgi:hypothetical protein